jgi:hypothetical protein
VLLGQTLN